MIDADIDICVQCCLDRGILSFQFYIDVENGQLRYDFALLPAIGSTADMVFDGHTLRELWRDSASLLKNCNADRSYRPGQLVTGRYLPAACPYLMQHLAKHTEGGGAC